MSARGRVTVEKFVCTSAVVSYRGGCTYVRVSVYLDVCVYMYREGQERAEAGYQDALSRATTPPTTVIARLRVGRGLLFSCLLFLSLGALENSSSSPNSLSVFLSVSFGCLRVGSAPFCGDVLLH